MNVNYLNHENSDLLDTVNDFGDIEAGVKFRFLDQGQKYPFSLAYQGGVSIPTSGNDTPWFFEIGGLVLTKDFSDAFSMDTDFVFGIVEDDGWNFISNVGFGYYLVPWFQVVLEGAYAYEDIESERYQRWHHNPRDGRPVGVLRYDRQLYQLRQPDNPAQQYHGRERRNLRAPPLLRQGP